MRLGLLGAACDPSLNLSLALYILPYDQPPTLHPVGLPCSPDLCSRGLLVPGPHVAGFPGHSC